MATGTTDYGGNKILNAVLAATALGNPATWYLGLLNTMATKAGAGGVEVTGGSYARQPITANSTNFPAATAQLIKLATSVTFPTATADWSTLLAPTVGWGLFDTLAGSIATSMWYQSPFISTWYGVTAVTTGNKFTAPGTTFTNGQTVMLESVTGVSLPGGFSADTVYYVVSASGDTFSLSATSGGAAITVSADGAGLIGVVQAQAILNGDTASFAANALTIQGS